MIACGHSGSPLVRHDGEQLDSIRTQLFLARWSGQDHWRRWLGHSSGAPMVQVFTGARAPFIGPLCKEHSSNSVQASVVTAMDSRRSFHTSVFLISRSPAL